MSIDCDKINMIKEHDKNKDIKECIENVYKDGENNDDVELQV